MREELNDKVFAPVATCMSGQWDTIGAVHGLDKKIDRAAVQTG
jgi:hypothetical protein